MKIRHITPMYLSKNSYIGGGERYPFELAKALANYKEHQVVLVSFGNEEKVFS